MVHNFEEFLYPILQEKYSDVVCISDFQKYYGVFNWPHSLSSSLSWLSPNPAFVAAIHDFPGIFKSHNSCIFHSPLSLLSNSTLNYSYNPLSKTQYILIIEFKIKKRLLSTWYARNSIKILLWIWEALFQPNVTYWLPVSKSGVKGGFICWKCLR